MNTHKVVLVCVVPHSSIHVLANDLCVTDLQWKTLTPLFTSSKLPGNLGTGRGNCMENYNMQPQGNPYKSG